MFLISTKGPWREGSESNALKHDPQSCAAPFGFQPKIFVVSDHSWVPRAPLVFGPSASAGRLTRMEPGEGLEPSRMLPVYKTGAVASEPTRQTFSVVSSLKPEY